MKKCCTHYHSDTYSDGHVILPAFKVKMCDNCGEVHLVCNDFLQAIFEIFLAPFWNGKVFIKDIPPVKKNAF